MKRMVKMTLQRFYLFSCNHTNFDFCVKVAHFELKAKEKGVHRSAFGRFLKERRLAEVHFLYKSG